MCVWYVNLPRMLHTSHNTVQESIPKLGHCAILMQEMASLVDLEYRDLQTLYILMCGCALLPYLLTLDQ